MCNFTTNGVTTCYVIFIEVYFDLYSHLSIVNTEQS